MSDPRDRDLAQHHRDDGYLILENFIDPARIDAVVAEDSCHFDPAATFPTASRHVRDRGVRAV